MSDYLSHLVNRVHFPQGAIRPRLAARFEPVSGLGDTPTAAEGPTALYPTGVDEEDQLQGIPMPEAPVPRVAPASSAQKPAAVGPTAAPEVPAAAQRARIQPAPPMPISHEETSSPEAHFQRIRRTVFPQAPSLPAPLATEPVSPAVASAEERALPLPQAPMETDQPTFVAPLQRQVHLARPAQVQPVRQTSKRTIPTVTPTNAGTPFQPHLVEHRSETTSPATPGEQSVVPNFGSAPAAGAGTVQGQTFEPVTPPRRAATPITPRLPEPPLMETRLVNRQSAAPVIRVTIGRIEVRATPAQPERNRRQPAPAARPPLPQPALSLDAYLKQRGDSR